MERDFSIDPGIWFPEVAQQYANDVLSGKIRACHWVKQAAKRHLRDLAKSEDPNYPFYYDHDRAGDVCDFAEKMPHIEGSWGSPLIVLAPWQIFNLCNIFGWRKRANGFRKYSKVYFEVARKNAKSTLAAVVSLYCLTCDGENAPYVFIGATTGAQALKVFHPARMMVIKSPDLAEAFGLQAWAKSVTEKGGGYIQTVNAKAKTQDGHNPHLVVLDELHAHESRDLYDVMDSATGARKQALMLIITTAGFDTNGICYEQRIYATKILDEVVEAEHYYCIIYTLDKEEVDAAKEGTLDPHTFIKANPNLGVSVDEDKLLDAAKEAREQPGKLGEFLTKRLNVWTSAKFAHINVVRWKACNGQVDLEKLRYYPCYLGFDLASVSDLTSLRAFWPTEYGSFTFGFRYLPEAAVLPRTNKNSVPYARWQNMGLPAQFDMNSDIGAYLKGRKLLTVTPGDVTDYAYLEKDIRWFCKNFKVQMIGFDRHNAQDLVNRLVADDLPMIEVRQGGITLNGPMKEIDRLYLGQDLAHNGDEILTWCASNVVKRPDHNDNYAPSKKLSHEKIDDYTALLNAVAPALSEEVEGPSVYEERGVLLI